MNNVVSAATAHHLIFNGWYMDFVTTDSQKIRGQVIATELRTPNHFLFSIRDNYNHTYYAEVKVE